MERDLKINLHYNVQSADQSSEGYQKRAKSRIAELLAAEQAAEKAKLDAVQKTAAAKTQESAKVGQADATAKRDARMRHDIEMFQLAESHKERMAAWDKQQAKQQQLRATGADLIKTMMGFAAVRSIVGGIADDFNRTSREIMESAKQFQDLRAAMQQVAALKGEKNQTAFTLQQVAEAEAAGLTPDEWRKSQEEFQSRAGAYLEGDQAKMDQAQGATYQQKIARFAKSRGIAASDASNLGGSLLQFSEGPQAPEKLMARYGKVFKTLERAPTPVAQLMPQMSRIQAQGFSPEEAAQALSIMSEALPGEEETGVENAMRAITKARIEGKGADLGLKEGMSPMQQIEAAARTLKSRIDKGEKEDDLMKEYAPDMRERKGLLGFINRGVKQKGFERVRGYAKDTPDDFTEQASAEYRTSDAGRQNAVTVALAAEQARMGARSDLVSRRRQIAEYELMKTGQFENVPAGDRLSGMVYGRLGGVDERNQQINRQMLRRARGELGESSGPIDNATSLNNQATDNVMRDLLKRIEENTRRGKGRGSAPPAAMQGRPAPVAVRAN